MGETHQPKAAAENPDKEVKVAEWADAQVGLVSEVNEQIRNEIARLKTYDQHCIPVKVKNISTSGDWGYP